MHYNIDKLHRETGNCIPKSCQKYRKMYLDSSKLARQFVGDTILPFHMLRLPS